MQDLLDLSKGSPSQSPLASPTASRGHGGTTPRVATQLNWFRGNSISCLAGSPSAIRLRKVRTPIMPSSHKCALPWVLTTEHSPQRPVQV